MTSVPIARVISVASRMSTPSVRIASVPRSAVRTRRISSASISSDSSAAATTATSTAGQNPIESCRRPTRYAPTSSTLPCAKLMTPVARKIVTNPSATSA